MGSTKSSKAFRTELQKVFMGSLDPCQRRPKVPFVFPPPDGAAPEEERPLGPLAFAFAERFFGLGLVLADAFGSPHAFSFAFAFLFGFPAGVTSALCFSDSGSLASGE